MENEPKQKKPGFYISVPMALKLTGLVLLTFLFVKFINSIDTILLLFFAAIFFAIALNPIVAKISRVLRIKNRNLTTGLAFVVVITILLGLLLSTVPPVRSQVEEFAEDLPEKVKIFTEGDSFIANLVEDYELDTNISSVASSVASYFAENTFNLVQKIFSALVYFVIFLAMTFMILIEGPGFVDQFKAFLPAKKSAKWQRLGRQMSEVIVSYVNGQVIIAVIGGLFALLFMSIIGIPNALALATIVAFFALVPLVGALVGAAIVVLLTLLVDINHALLLIIYFIVYQQIENITIQPWIQGQQTNLSPLQVLIAAMIGASVAGIAGVLLAVPIVACLKILLVDYFRTNKDRLEKKYLHSNNSN